MADIYLHHYPASLFSEKIRLMLGYLRLTWYSVETSSVMPRPLLMPLTGGYRKTPNLQIGANIYSDTSAITTGLLRHTSNDTLYHAGFSAHRIAEWADSALFATGVALNFRPEAAAGFLSQMSESEILAFQKDRAELTGDAPITTLAPAAAEAHLRTVLEQMENSIRGNFLFGDIPSIADFSIYHCLWFIQNNAFNAPLLEPFVKVKDWMDTMRSFGHGNAIEASGEDALAHAATELPVAPAVEFDPPDGFAAGDMVSVTPADYGRVPVAGTLVSWSPLEIVIERNEDGLGRLMNHFPNAGFVLAIAG
jgi:glutathione S-transferase